MDHQGEKELSRVGELQLTNVVPSQVLRGRLAMCFHTIEHMLRTPLLYSCSRVPLVCDKMLTCPLVCDKRRESGHALRSPMSTPTVSSAPVEAATAISAKQDVPVVKGNVIRKITKCNPDILKCSPDALTAVGLALVSLFIHSYILTPASSKWFIPRNVTIFTTHRIIS